MSDSDDSLHLGIAYGDTLTWLSDDDLSATLDDAAAMGIKWIRVDLSWANIQPDSHSGYRWELFDRVADAAAKRDLQLLPIVSYTPPWARPDGCPTEKCAPADPGEFAEFAGEAASRYREVTTWEVWNEENSQVFWQPHPDPVAYSTLFELTADSLRGSNPAAKVLIGGLAITEPDRGGISPRDFVGALIDSGAVDAADGVAIHPYTYPNLASARGPWVGQGQHASSSVQGVRDVFRRAGVPELPVWITEYGAPTGGEPGSDDHVTEMRQAQIAFDAVKTAAADSGVAALMWYTYRDSGADTADPESHYGLRRADGSAKPAYDAFVQAIADSPR
ncbi:MAG: cellulase family glycosylhydrolase [Mycobacterium sp.]